MPSVVHVHAATHIGRRSENQDRYLVDRDASLFAVADGIGGHEGGAIASALAIETLAGFFARAASTDRRESGVVREARMDMAFRMAHREVEKRRVGTLARMGTTLVALRVESDGTAVLAHVGDSRAYRLRTGALERLTRDHSLAAELELELGVAAHSHPDIFRYTHVLTRAVGSGEPGHDIATVDLARGDVLLLATDGLFGTVTDARIRRVLESAPPELAATALVSEAWLHDATDNITVVVAYVD